jgi:hypothetical protein
MKRPIINENTIWNFFSLKISRNWKAAAILFNLSLIDMSVFDHFMLVPFLIGLFLGLFLIYYDVNLPSEKIAKWPHPTNADKLVFKDKNGLCFKFEFNEIDCKTEGLTIKDYPHDA